MRPTALPRRVAAGFALALLLPLASALAGFAGTDWFTEGRLVVSGGGSRGGGFTTLAASFPDETSFSVEDPDGLVLTGTMAPVGKKGTSAAGTLDGDSEDAFASGLEQTLVDSYGGEWTVTPVSSEFKAKLTRGETRVKVKLRILVDVWYGGSGRTRRFKVAISTRTRD